MGLRLHLVELEDLPWFPVRLRDLMTDALSALQAELRLEETMAVPLRQALEAAGAGELVDLCSGAGGVLPKLRRTLARQGLQVNVMFTDRYPNQSALASACSQDPDGMRFSSASVDAADIPPHLTGFRTLFTSFHHFRPADAQAILRNAHEARAGIAIFEITERSLVAFLRNALTPLACWAVTPRIRPLTLERLLFTYLLPVVPLVLTWDGFVSNLRTYTPRELKKMTSSLRSDDYAWRIGKVRGAFGQVTTYLIGLHEPSVSSGSSEPHHPQVTKEKGTNHVSL